MDVVVDLVTSCFDKVKDHDFAGANACAAVILANSSLWSGLTYNLTTIFQQYRMIMAGRPKLVVAVTGYPNPYPKTLDVTEKIPGSARSWRTPWPPAWPGGSSCRRLSRRSTRSSRS